MEYQIEGLGTVKKAIVNVLGLDGWPTFKFFESGGFPDVGDLFIANEAGPELIGTMNGQSAVASNNEITGIRDAVYDTSEQELVLLRQQNQLLQAILQKEGLTDGKLYNSVVKSDREYRNRTGRSSFAY